MQVPCPACGTIARVTNPGSESAWTLVDCPGCSGRFRVAVQVPESAAPPPPRPQPVAAAPVPAPRATRATAQEPEALPYDPGFAEAVRDGCLSVFQAVERGDRAALASHLSKRHRLPMDLAYMAADQRMTIRQAVMQKHAREVAPAERSSRGLLYTGIVLLLALGGICIGAYFKSASAPETVSSSPGDAHGARDRFSGSTSPGATRIIPKTDSAGRVVEVAGPDPRSVLVSFCTSGPDASLREPMEVMELTPPSPAWRLGVFRMTMTPSEPMRAIRIRRDEATLRWVAGDGQSPIPTEELRAAAAAAAVPSGTVAGASETLGR